jgi:Flp pilus assembly protein TadG
MRMRLDSKRGFQRRCATAAVEFAVVMPLVAGLLVGLLEVGRIVQINQLLCNAAREAARNASTGINTYANAQTVVTNYLTNAGITNLNGLTVTIYDVSQNNSGPSFNPSSALWCDQLQVTVTLPLSNVQLTSLSFLPTDPNTIISAQAVWYSNQDQAYPTSITPPAGN